MLIFKIYSMLFFVNKHVYTIYYAIIYGTFVFVYFNSKIFKHLLNPDEVDHISLIFEPVAQTGGAPVLYGSALHKAHLG